MSADTSFAYIKPVSVLKLGFVTLLNSVNISARKMILTWTWGNIKPVIDWCFSVPYFWSITILDFQSTIYCFFRQKSHLQICKKGKKWRFYNKCRAKSIIYISPFYFSLNLIITLSLRERLKEKWAGVPPIPQNN